MRHFAASACLALLLTGCGESGSPMQSTWEGLPASDWARLTKDTNVETRRRAVVALGELGLPDASESVPALADATADEDPAVRLMALQSLEKLAPKASKAQAKVTRAMSDKNKVIMKQAMKTFKAIELAKPSPLNPN
jgi:hypothetical protein